MAFGKGDIPPWRKEFNHTYTVAQGRPARPGYSTSGCCRLQVILSQPSCRHRCVTPAGGSVLRQGGCGGQRRGHQAPARPQPVAGSGASLVMLAWLLLPCCRTNRGRPSPLLCPACRRPCTLCLPMRCRRLATQLSVVGIAVNTVAF